MLLGHVGSCEIGNWPSFQNQRHVESCCSSSEWPLSGHSRGLFAFKFLRVSRGRPSPLASPRCQRCLYTRLGLSSSSAEFMIARTERIASICNLLRTLPSSLCCRIESLEATESDNRRSSTRALFSSQRGATIHRCMGFRTRNHIAVELHNLEFGAGDEVTYAPGEMASTADHAPYRIQPSLPFATEVSSLRPCSRNNNDPPGFSTRRTSRRALVASGMCTM
jgi:hypothetical protein